MLINLVFVFLFGFLLLALVFLWPKQRLSRPVQSPPRPTYPTRQPAYPKAQSVQPRPRSVQAEPRPKIDLRRKPTPQAAADGIPEAAIKAVTVYTHDRATAKRLIQSYRRNHSGQDWNETANQVIQDLIRDRR